MSRQRKSHKLSCLLLCTLLASGCTSTPTPISQGLRQQLGKVYLYSAGPTGETFFDTDFATGGAGGAFKGAGQGAYQGLDSCLNNAVSAGVLGVLVMAICTPLAVPGSMIKGTMAGSTAAIPQDTLANIEQHANTVLQNADLSPALVATLDELSQHYDVAQFEISHGTLPAPASGETVHAVAARWDYQTVMEIQVTKAGFESHDSRVPMAHFAMTAEMRLVETGSGKILKKQEYTYHSMPQQYGYWFNDNNRVLLQEITKGNRKVAGDIINNVFLK